MDAPPITNLEEVIAHAIDAHRDQLAVLVHARVTAVVDELVAGEISNGHREVLQVDPPTKPDPRTCQSCGQRPAAPGRKVCYACRERQRRERRQQEAEADDEEHPRPNEDGLPVGT